MATISYAITACNEHKELTKLLDLLRNINPEDEIVLLLDWDNTTDLVRQVAKDFNESTPNIHFKIITEGLKKDFATFKNVLKISCTRDYIFFIDADEYPGDALIYNLHELLDSNPVDMIAVPRVNTVEGLTEQHVSQWGWVLNDKSWVNWPDYQMRICKNVPEIYWVGKVHERLEGWITFATLPNEDDTWALYHPKDIKRQEKQNSFYNTI